MKRRVASLIAILLRAFSSPRIDERTKRRVVYLITALLGSVRDRFVYRQTKVYGTFPSNIKTTFRRD